ncbi:MAG TPA: hypothetical protein VFS92_09360 [Planctomycetota bacterium]|nr:hypothetical protein [Planctomycetota bacterium]
MRSWLRVAAASFLACGGSLALASIDVEIPPNFKVKSNIAPGETEVFRFTGTQAASLTMTVKATGKSTFLPEPVLIDPQTLMSVSPAPVSVVKSGGRSVSWKKSYLLPYSGKYLLLVSGAGQGDCSLSLKAAPARRFAGQLDFSTFPTLDFPFSVPPGSSLKAVVRAAPGSMARPEFQSLFGPDAYNEDLSGEGTKTGTSHSVELAPLSAGGDYSLRVVNVGIPGAVTIFVTLTPPKVRPVRLDLRDSVLGRPFGGGTFVARTIDGDGGLVEVVDSSSDLDRAAVSVPAGAVQGDTIISIGSAEEPLLGSADDQAAGPAVDLRPSGTQFVFPVTVTLPFDFTRIPVGSTPDDILIRVVEDNGAAVEVPPDSVDVPGGTVSVQTSGFSICIPVIGSGPPSLGFDSRGQVKPGGDEFWLMSAFAEYYPDAGMDSRERRIGTSFGTLSFHSDGSFEFAALEHQFQWLNSNGTGTPIQSSLTESNQPTSGNLSWAYDASGRRIQLSGSPETLPTFRISRDGRTIAGREEGSDEPYAEAIFGIRKNDAPIGPGSIRGAWNGVYFEMSAESTPSTGAAEPVLLRGLATVTFDGVGGARLSISERETGLNVSNGSFTQSLGSVTVNTCTYVVDEDGTVLLTIPPFGGDDDGTTLRFFPGQGLEVMFGGHDQVIGHGAFAVVLVRQGSGQSKADLSGFYHGAAFGTDPVSYQTPVMNPIRIADLNARAEGTLATFNGGSTATLTFEPHEVQRNAAQAGGLEVGNGSETFDLSVNLASTGKLTLGPASSGGAGAATQDGDLLVVTSSLGNATGDFGLIFFFLAPPDQSP